MSSVARGPAMNMDFGYSNATICVNTPCPAHLYRLHNAQPLSAMMAIVRTTSNIIIAKAALHRPQPARFAVRGIRPS
jgi:hypothetical protein